MNHTKKTLLAALAVAVGSFAVPAQAAFITGSLSFTGFGQAPTCGGALVCDAGNLTGVDFPAGSPNASAGDTFGDFSGLTEATFYDVMLTTPATVWTSGPFSFAFLGTPNVSFSTDAYTIRFSGVMTAAGFDDTNGTLVYTGNQAGGGQTSSWSASQAVPVPASAALLGIGLLGLAGVARRRRAA